MFGETIRAIIDLLKLRKDEKKVDLEIGQPERAKAKEESAIQIATFSDIQRFDPRARKIAQQAERDMPSYSRPHDGMEWLRVNRKPWYARLFPWIAIAAIVYVLYRTFAG